MSSLDEGWQARLEAASKAADIYDYISDTPIRTLQTDERSRRIGEMVTEARGLYRRSESFGNGSVRRRAGHSAPWTYPAATSG